MNNFELDEQAKALSDTLTPYALAKRVIELEEKYNKLIKALEHRGTSVEMILRECERVEK